MKSKFVDVTPIIAGLKEMSGGTAYDALEYERRSLYSLVADMLESAPAADVVPIHSGEWEKRKDRDTIKCSSCGFQMFPLDAYQKGEWPNMCVTFCKEQRYTPRFCPDCGADMENDER